MLLSAVFEDFQLVTLLLNIFLLSLVCPSINSFFTCYVKYNPAYNLWPLSAHLRKHHLWRFADGIIVVRY